MRWHPNVNITLFFYIRRYLGGVVGGGGGGGDGDDNTNRSNHDHHHHCHSNTLDDGASSHQFSPLLLPSHHTYLDC